LAPVSNFIAIPFFSFIESFTREILPVTDFQKVFSLLSDMDNERASMETPNAKQKATMAS
jgi:hypothetical protein